MSDDIHGFEWSREESTLVDYAVSRHVPLVGMFELTPRCNLRCKMCYVHMSAAEIKTCGKNELTTRQWLDLAEQAVKAGTLYLTLTGGEPLIRDDFTEIYSALSNMGFRLGINTNASLITSKYEQLFAKYPPKEFLVTLYGADADTYHRVCGNRVAFNNVIAGLGFISGLPSNLKIRATFIRDNKDQLKRLRDIAGGFNKKLLVNPFVNLPGPGVSTDAGRCRMSAGECADLIEEQIGYENTDVNQNLFDGIRLDKPGEPIIDSDVYPGIITCQAARSMYHIKWDGKLCPCISFLSIYTSPLEVGLKEAWEQLPGLMKELKRPDKCAGCKYFYRCKVCPARVEAETGSFNEAPEYICGVVKEMDERKIK